MGTRAIERPTDFTFPDQEAASPPILFLSLFSRRGKVKENRERRRERHQGVKNRIPGYAAEERGRPPLSVPQNSSISASSFRLFHFDNLKLFFETVPFHSQ